ncbi:MAG: hypothetical protein ACD_17C00091G0003 [uncultured bacterium]|nr:MAG: hypothetical protein ACD_17C00091G0003 [uncultured bacterium]OGN55409.1 MAG: hypothetical protein A2796_02640 [Chlamydiae bacterium RIFCSPHIGHO2_01_FULL_44_39]OGN56808.1 MAG: hypothetical protein A3C42_02330 [Chlamydiae bacterium RIFCSPHIGHO2_02_FULL_45_9]OGN59913.1 MAG: hypothetical protein A3D96_03955 [Chlamydiae bacterium RIFCSPHIGHO2_12_FULL_44_59]OGN66120.1 MAG: hypothetical protein A2978_04470 [Chlamydiae bacterium RIFCSPLOWO2_01_FULL_44_52]OGN68655.1 MAG: hypothetical protein A3
MLHVETLNEGMGIPIVFLHGFLGNLNDWRPLVSCLPEFHCIGIDLPGHGKSVFTESFELNFPRFHLVGYSLGGRIAMQLQKRHSERIASLHLLSTHPGLITDEEKKQRWNDDRAWAEKLQQLPIDEFLIQWYDQAIFNSFTPDLGMRRRQNISGLVSALLHYSLAKQSRFEIDGVIVGEKDEKFRSLFQKPVLISGAAHMVHLENPKELSLLLRRRII